MNKIITVFAIWLICLFVKAEGINFTILDGKDSLDINPHTKMVGKVSIPTDLYEIVVKKDLEQADCQHRKNIYESIKKMISAYNKRDIDLLKECMSYSTIIEWTESDKPEVREWGLKMKRAFDQYLDPLESTYKSNADIKAYFDEIEIIRHPVNPYFYGVTIKQGWATDNYHDEGYLFQIWDFMNENTPLIHICTWQSAMTNGKPLPKDEVFSLSDFDI